MRLMHERAMFHTAHMTINLLPSNQRNYLTLTIMANLPIRFKIQTSISGPLSSEY